jgi:hypothetical protein
MTGRKVTFIIESEELENAFKQWARKNRYKLYEAYNMAVKSLIGFNNGSPQSVDPDGVKQELEEIKIELQRLRRMVEQQGFHASTQVHEAQTTLPSSSSGLPSFLKDNPWVEILATRGEEQT